MTALTIHMDMVRGKLWPSPRNKSNPQRAIGERSTPAIRTCCLCRPPRQALRRASRPKPRSYGRRRERIRQSSRNGSAGQRWSMRMGSRESCNMGQVKNLKYSKGGRGRTLDFILELWSRHRREYWTSFHMLRKKMCRILSLTGRHTYCLSICL